MNTVLDCSELVDYICSYLDKGEVFNFHNAFNLKMSLKWVLLLTKNPLCSKCKKHTLLKCRNCNRVECDFQYEECCSCEKVYCIDCITKCSICDEFICTSSDHCMYKETCNKCTKLVCYKCSLEGFRCQGCRTSVFYRMVYPFYCINCVNKCYRECMGCPKCGVTCPHNSYKV